LRCALSAVRDPLDERHRQALGRNDSGSDRGPAGLAAGGRGLGWRDAAKGRQSARPKGRGLLLKPNPTMRALKIAGITIGAIVGLVVLAVVVIVLVVDPNDYRDDIAKLVEEKTGRPLQIRGELDLKLFPWIALEIHDVTLGNPPGYGTDPFLTVSRASVGVKLLPLLRKQVEVRRVSVDGLAVTLISRSEEENNWKDLGESDAQKTPDTGSPAKATIAGLDVSKSTLIYRDDAEKSVTRLTNLEAHTGALGGGDPVDAEFAFDYDDGGSARVAHIETKARIVMAAETSRVEVQKLDAKADWYGSPEEGSEKAAAAKPTGKPIAIRVNSDSLVLDTKAETLAPAILEVKLGALPVKVSASGEKLFSAYVVSGQISVPKISPREVMQSFDIEEPVTADPKALTSLELTSNFRLTETQLQLSTLDLSLDETKVKGSAGIEDLEAMALRFDLDVNAIDVDRYLEPEKPEAAGGSAPAAGQAAAAPPTDLPLETLRGLNAKGQLRIGRAKVADLPFSEVRLPMEAKEGRTHLGPTQAKLFGGTYDGDIVLDARPAQATLSMDEHVRSIDIGALMKAGFDTTRVVGKGNANARLTAAGNTDAAMFKSLAGKIDFDVKDGAVAGLDLWYELRRAVALFKRQAPPARPAGEPKTAFNALAGSAIVDKGVLRNDDLIVDMSYIRAKGKGSLALASQAVDYRLVTEIYKLPAGDEADMADLKAAEIPVTITGTLADMKVRPDVEGYLKARFKKEVDKKVDEKKEELKKKLGDKLKGLLGQ
jgi:AsmA protein